MNTVLIEIGANGLESLDLCRTRGAFARRRNDEVAVCCDHVMGVMLITSLFVRPFLVCMPTRSLPEHDITDASRLLIGHVGYGS